MSLHWTEILTLAVVALPLGGAAALTVLGLSAPRRPEGLPAEVGDAAEQRLVAWARVIAAATLLAVLVLVGAKLAGETAAHVSLGVWFGVADFELPLSFYLDAYSLPFAVLIALLVWLVVLFSARYLHREDGVARFYAGVLLLAAGMLLIALAGNAGLAFVGWEFAGLSSWLLIGYSLARDTATTFALRAFVTNRIGDAGFIVGLAAASFWLGSLEWPVIANATQGLGEMTGGMLVLGFVVAAGVKSAQVPFSPWLTRALEGPTPSSAIFYGALLVHAGVYLLIRLDPVLAAAPILRALIAAMGAATIVYGVVAGWVQSDVKSALALSTLTQVGLMFVTLGAGHADLAYAHLLLHAAWRAHQFLLAPSFLRLSDEPARPLAAWIRRYPALYRAASNRFWLEAQADALLVRPTRGLGRDVNAFDQQVVSRLMGGSERGQDGHDADALMRGYGAAGRLLAALADACAALETRLVLRGKEGHLAQALERVGRYLGAIEVLLERPRYLLVLIMATFAVLLS